MPDPADDPLVEAARAGDQAALESLLARYQGRILRFSRKMCGRGEDARDVLQDTLFAVARGIRDFRGGASLSTWLYTIARSHCIKKRRRSRFAPEEVSLETEDGRAAAWLPHPGPAPDELLAGREAQERLDHALSLLDVAHREVLVLRDVEGLTASETAEVLHLSVDAVKSRLHRARAAFRAALQPSPLPDATASGPCPDIVDLFSRKLDGELGREACAEAERHVASCRRCAALAETLQEAFRLCRAAPTPEATEQVDAIIRSVVREAGGNPIQRTTT